MDTLVASVAVLVGVGMGWVLRWIWVDPPPPLDYARVTKYQLLPAAPSGTSQAELVLSWLDHALTRALGGDGAFFAERPEWDALLARVRSSAVVAGTGADASEIALALAIQRVLEWYAKHRATFLSSEAQAEFLRLFVLGVETGLAPICEPK